LDVEVHLLTTGSKLQAPIKMVDGHPWSPGVYQLLRLLGKTLEDGVIPTNRYVPIGGKQSLKNGPRQMHETP
jgi:hypothetical protein